MNTTTERRRIATAWVGRMGGGIVGCLAWFVISRIWPEAGWTLLVSGCLAAGAFGGIAVLRRAVAWNSGVLSVAGTVVEEVVRMRSTLALVIVFVAVLPTLPLVLDPGERLAYRVQFLLTWSLGTAGLILGLLTAFLACGSVSGDIDSGRIHLTLAKPLHRWEYLVGKWLGILLYDILLVAGAGAGIYLLVQLMASTPAVDDVDRDALRRQVLVARQAIRPEPDDPAGYDAAIAAATARLQADAPDLFARGTAAVRRRIRQEYDWQWHTVAPDMETTYLFPGVGPAARRGGEIQLQLEPRANNVGVDFAEVRFALWLNGRPWPLEGTLHVPQTIPSRARQVFELPREQLTDADDLRVRIANRNLVPAGETTATAITFPPGDGLEVYARVGGFEGNYFRCLMIMVTKLALVAAAGVAAAAMLDFPAAILTTLVIYFGSLGHGFFQDALGRYDVVAGSAWEQAATRIAFATESLGQRRFYEAFRMVFGFVTDGILALLPSFGADAAITKLATGMVIPLADVCRSGLVLGLAYPLAFGLVGWLVFDRRDLIRSVS
jgi:hypothetical protein